MKIKRKYKIWGLTLLIHLTLIFLFSNFGLKYKNPPDPQQSIEIEFDRDTQGDEETEIQAFDIYGYLLSMSHIS